MGMGTPGALTSGLRQQSLNKIPKSYTEHVLVFPISERAGMTQDIQVEANWSARDERTLVLVPGGGLVRVLGKPLPCLPVGFWLHG